MIIARSASHLTHELNTVRYRFGTKRCVSLITMRGSFHDGHGAIMNAAKTISDVVVVAIASQPDQDKGNVISASEFQDIAFLEKHGVDMLYTPAEEEMFPRGYEFMFSVRHPHPCDVLDVGSYRLTQHIKLINTVQPDVMVWGEKNFIEFHNVRQLINELNIPTQVQCVPTVRHADGVAVCSSVEYMTPAERNKAPILWETLNNVAHAIRTGARGFEKIENTARLALRGAGLKVSHFKILDEENLAPASNKTATYRIVGSVKLGKHAITDSLGLTL